MENEKKKFDVTVRCITYLHAEVEAEDFEEAHWIAEDLDGGEFEEEWGTSEWDIWCIQCENGEVETYNI